MLEDQPKTLRDVAERKRRGLLLAKPHIAPLAKYVVDLRTLMGTRYRIPDFDPLDGGIEANVLVLLEAPGPKAIETGFVSRNNPDESAKNVFRAFADAGLARIDTVLWNVVPWYLGTGRRIRAATRQDLADAKPASQALMEILHRLQAVVLMGKKASQGYRTLNLTSTAKVYETLHPSPKVYATRKTARADINGVLRDVADYIGR